MAFATTAMANDTHVNTAEITTSIEQSLSIAISDIELPEISTGLAADMQRSGVELQNSQLVAMAHQELAETLLIAQLAD